MKSITLVRHAKSSWKDPSLADVDRPLNKRGKRDGPKMGQRLADRGCDPQLILSSPAVRALATAEILAEEIGYPVEEIVVDPRLYGAEVTDWLAVIRSLDDSLTWVMGVGHNPALTELANELSPGPRIDNLPTCGVVELTFDVDTWAEVGRPAAGVDFDYPKKARIL